MDQHVDLDSTQEKVRSSMNIPKKDGTEQVSFYVTDKHSWFFMWVVSPWPEHKEKNLGYRVLFEADEEGGYIATIPRLPGVVTEGDTLEETIDYLQDALEGWLQVAHQKGLEIPEPDKHMYL